MKTIEVVVFDQIYSFQSEGEREKERGREREREKEGEREIKRKWGLKKIC